MDPDAHRHTQKNKEASIIKASVGPGERKSVFQLPSCLTGITVYSSVAVTAPYVFGTGVAWPRWSQCGHTVEKRIDTPDQYKCIASI